MTNQPISPPSSLPGVGISPVNVIIVPHLLPAGMVLVRVILQSPCFTSRKLYSISRFIHGLFHGVCKNTSQKCRDFTKFHHPSGSFQLGARNESATRVLRPVPASLPGVQHVRPQRRDAWLGYIVEIDDISYVYGYGSIPIDTIFSGMNIHLPAILGFTRYQGFDPSPYHSYIYTYIEHRFG